MPTNILCLRTAKKRQSHSFHAFFWHTRPSCTFSFTKATRCLKLLIAASNAIGRWGIAVELSPEFSLNRNNWFVLHKLQHTKHLLLWSCHNRFVTSQTEREEGSGIAHAHKTRTPAVSFHVGNLVCESRNGRLKPVQLFWYTLYKVCFFCAVRFHEIAAMSRNPILN
jgi:hypothetical protein